VTFRFDLEGRHGLGCVHPRVSVELGQMCQVVFILVWFGSGSNLSKVWYLYTDQVIITELRSLAGSEESYILILLTGSYLRHLWNQYCTVIAVLLSLSQWRDYSCLMHLLVRLIWSGWVEFFHISIGCVGLSLTINALSSIWSKKKDLCPSVLVSCFIKFVFLPNTVVASRVHAVVGQTVYFSIVCQLNVVNRM